MENAADALKMAGAVLLFVIALSIIIFYFGQVRESADTILNYRDRETSYYYYEQTDGTERYVNLDTIVPSVFRAYLENYKIVFDGIDSPIYKIKSPRIGNNLVEKYTLDLETNQGKQYNNVVLANDEQKANFIKGVFYGYDREKMEKDFKDLGVSLEGCEPLYNQLTKKVSEGCKIKECLGVYYQNDNENDPDVNKTKKRVITYKIVK